MKQYWLHRISGEPTVTHPLLQRNILSIGYCNVRTEHLLSKLKNDLKGTLTGLWGNFKRDVSDLDRFVNSMKAGDYVIVPNYPKYGRFSIYKIADDAVFTTEALDVTNLKTTNGVKVCRNSDNYLQVNGKTIDLGLYRNVECIVKGIVKKDIHNQLSSSLNYPATNCSLNKNASIIENLVNQYLHPKYIICDFAGSSWGKTTTLVTVAELLKKHFSPIHYQKNGNDVYALFNINNKIVAVVTMGDPSSSQKQKLDKAVKSNADVIVCASRECGISAQRVYDVINNGYKGIWFKNFHSDDSNTVKINADGMAQGIIRTIANLLNLPSLQAFFTL